MADNLNTLLSTFEESFYQRAQQMESVLLKSGVCDYKALRSAEENIQSMDRVNLQKTEGTNPEKIYQTWGTNNRKMVSERFTISLAIDKKKDDLEQVISPDGELIKQAKFGVARLIDTYGARALLGSVDIAMAGRGSSNIITAAADGVLTVDATAGLSYAKILEARKNFIKNDVDAMDYNKSIFLGTQTEWGALMNEDKFINNDFINSRPVESGNVPNIFGSNFAFLGGSESGFTKENPILEETSGTRKCIMACPKSLAIQLSGLKINVSEDPDKYADSRVITFLIYVGAMRLEGAKVQQITTTI